MTTTPAQQIKWHDLLAFCAPAGRRAMVEFVQQAREERGVNWLPEIKAEYPLASWILDLVCNHTADEAFERLQADFPHYPLSLARGPLTDLHAALRAEIDRKR